MQSGTCLGLHALPDCVTVMTMNEKPHISEICAGLDPYALSGDFAARGYEVGQHAGVEACIAALNLLVTIGERPSAMSTDDELETYRRFANTVRAHEKLGIIGSLAMFITDELAAGRLLK